MGKVLDYDDNSSLIGVNVVIEKITAEPGLDPKSSTKDEKWIIFNGLKVIFIILSIN